MGQRCNLTIIENGAATVYYDHWAANVLDESLFWGADDTLAFIRQRDPMDAPLLDNVWGEGGAVVDLDRKRLTWFGGEDLAYDIILKRVHAACMARNWPGWTIQWATEGVATLANAMGVPFEDTSKRKYDGEFYYEEAEWREDGDCLLTHLRDGTLTATRLAGETEGLALQDEADIAALISDKPVALDGKRLRLGAHVDADAKRLSFWTAAETYALDAIAAKWSGWTVEFWGDAFERHRARVPALNWPGVDAKAVREVIARLRHLVQLQRGNPALDSLKHLTKDGSDVQLNPATFESRAPTASDWKLSVLDAFEADMKGRAA